MEVIGLKEPIFNYYDNKKLDNLSTYQIFNKVLEIESIFGDEGFKKLSKLK